MLDDGQDALLFMSKESKYNNTIGDAVSIDALLEEFHANQLLNQLDESPSTQTASRKHGQIRVDYLAKRYPSGMLNNIKFRFRTRESSFLNLDSDRKRKRLECWC